MAGRVPTKPAFVELNAPVKKDRHRTPAVMPTYRFNRAHNSVKSDWMITKPVGILSMIIG